MIAAEAGAADVVGTLLAHKADTAAVDHEGRNAAAPASAAGRRDVARLLAAPVERR